MGKQARGAERALHVPHRAPLKHHGTIVPMRKWGRRKKHTYSRNAGSKKMDAGSRMLRRQVLVGIAIAFFLTAFGGVVYYVSHIESLQIAQVEVKGGYTIEHADIEEIANRTLQGNYFLLVPKRFFWTYPRNSIRAQIEALPRVKEVRMKRIGQTLSIVFDEYQPVALWCNNSSEEECFFLDKSGFAFAQAPELTGSAFVRYSQNNKSVSVKSQAVDRDFLRESQAFAEQLANVLGLYVTHVRIDNELDISYTVSGGGVLKVSRRMPLRDTFENLQTILTSEEFSDLESGEFAYIDLRFGDKIFVNTEMQDAQTQATSSSEDSMLDE